jgi:hypothetical protein
MAVYALRSLLEGVRVDRTIDLSANGFSRQDVN